jgi:hypothetical protein
VRVLRPAFWLVSACIALAGLSFELASVPLDRVLLIRALSPLLVYLGITSALRGVHLHTLESELGCPNSVVQLTVARIVVVLGFDVALGLLLSIPVWLGGSDSALAVTLYWLAPLLLVAGLALVLSLYLDVKIAAGIAYAVWIGGLMLAYAGSLAASQVGAHLPGIPGLVTEMALGVVGLGLLVAGVLRAPKAVGSLLPTI